MQPGALNIRLHPTCGLHQPGRVSTKIKKNILGNGKFRITYYDLNLSYTTCLLIPMKLQTLQRMTSIKWFLNR